MSKWRVYGTVTAEVYVNVEAADEEMAIEEAEREFGGIDGFCGNGGSDKLVGVHGTDESIEISDCVEWQSAEPVANQGSERE